MSSPIEFLFDGLTFAWVFIAAVSMFTGAWLALRAERENKPDIQAWQWGVFFWLGASLFTFLIASHYIQDSVILLVIEGFVILATIAFYLALLFHVKWGILSRTPQRIAEACIRDFLR